MKRFLISSLPFVSLVVTLKSSGVQLLTTKRISLLIIVTFCFAVKALSQTSGDRLLRIDSCFLAVKMDPKTKGISISKTFCVGDKIAVKQAGNIIRGKISKLSKNNIVIDNNYEIDASKIQWIKMSKLTASRAIAGVLVTAAGLALIPASQEADSFGQTGALVITGTVLVPMGVLIFVSRTKFRIDRGDKLIFND